MKKLFLTLAIVMAFVMGANAQFDGFVKNGGDEMFNRGSSSSISGTTPALPGGSIGAVDTDQSAPLGSGLLVLAALGAGYAVRKKNR